MQETMLSTATYFGIVMSPSQERNAFSTTLRLANTDLRAGRDPHNTSQGGFFSIT